MTASDTENAGDISNEAVAPSSPGRVTMSEDASSLHGKSPQGDITQSPTRGEEQHVVSLTPPSSPSRLRQRHPGNNSASTTTTSPHRTSAEAWSSFRRNDIVPTLDQRIGRPSRKALYNFFYTTNRQDNNTVVEPPNESNDASFHDDEEQPIPPIQPSSSLDYHATQEEEDKKWMVKFWKGYDDWILLSLFGFLGILFRLGAANWFAYFDDVFNATSALFTNLPLNCLSCFILGMLCSGNELFEIIATRQQRSREGERSEEAALEYDQDETQELCLQQPQTLDMNNEDDDSFGESPNSLRRRSHRQRSYSWIASGQSAEDELREVQLQALERRIRASSCLVLFPVHKEEMDVMDHYVNDGRFLGRERSRPQEQQNGLYDLSFTVEDDEDEEGGGVPATQAHVVVQDEEVKRKYSGDDTALATIEEDDPAAPDYKDEGIYRTNNSTKQLPSRVVTLNGHAPLPLESPSNGAPGATDDETAHDAQQVEGQGLDQFIHGVSANIQGVSTNITTNISRLNRVNLAEGWEDGTSARTMSDDLLLGLRTGFCGALSSFSSWNSSMVNLLRNGYFGEAFVGYIIGLQLPIVAYRFGQHAALYLFVWRCRRETKRDERRGYGLRLRQEDDDESEDEEEQEDTFVNEDGVVSAADDNDNNNSSPTFRRSSANKGLSPGAPEEDAERRTLSVRAVATAIFIIAIVLQIVSINVFTEPQQQRMAISLLFAPFGVLARWRLSKWNSWRPGFPLGTFTANMVACVLSGSLGSLLAGNPGPEESIVLVGMISGVGGSLSSLAQLVVEILAGIDPIIFKYDGITYAIATIWWGFVIGIVTRASMDWADEI